MYDIAIFDFDNTLIDTYKIYPIIYKRLLKDLGISESNTEHITPDYYYSLLQKELDPVRAILSNYCLKITPTKFKKLRNRLELWFFSGKEKEYINPISYLNTKIVNKLYKHHLEGTKCYIVSSNYGSVVEAALKTTKLDKYIEDIYCDCHVKELMTIHDKNQPKIETYKTLMGNKTIVYDDLPRHIEEAKGLGVDTVLVTV